MTYRQLTSEERTVIEKQIRNFHDERNKWVYLKEKAMFTIHKELPTNFKLQIKEWQEKLKTYNENLKEIDISLVNLSMPLERGVEERIEQEIDKINGFKFIENENIMVDEVIASPLTIEKLKQRMKEEN